MPSQAQHVRRLAAALAAGPMDDRETMLVRAKPLVGDFRKARWLEPLVRNLHLEFAEGPEPLDSPETLTAGFKAAETGLRDDRPPENHPVRPEL